MKKLKVLHIIRSLPISGAERLCVDICSELNKRDNIEIRLLSMSPINEYNEITKNINFKIIGSKVFPKIFKKSVIELKEYINEIDEFKPDIVHSHLFWSELLSRKYTKKNIIYVTHCHDNMIEFSNLSLKTFTKKLNLVRFFEKKWILNKYAKCENYFLTISKDSEIYYKEVLPKKLQKIKLLPNAIKLEKFCDAGKEKKVLKNPTLKLINIGSFLPKKNQSFLIDVAKEL